jgi:hypothetical protein
LWTATDLLIWSPSRQEREKTVTFPIFTMYTDNTARGEPWKKNMYQKALQPRYLYCLQAIKPTAKRVCELKYAVNHLRKKWPKTG